MVGRQREIDRRHAHMRAFERRDAIGDHGDVALSGETHQAVRSKMDFRGRVRVADRLRERLGLRDAGPIATMGWTAAPRAETARRAVSVRPPGSLPPIDTSTRGRARSEKQGTRRPPGFAAENRPVPADQQIRLAAPGQPAGLRHRRQRDEMGGLAALRDVVDRRYRRNQRTQAAHVGGRQVGADVEDQRLRLEARRDGPDPVALRLAVRLALDHEARARDRGRGRVVADHREDDAEALAILKGARERQASLHVPEAERAAAVAAHDDRTADGPRVLLRDMRVEARERGIAPHEREQVRERRFARLGVQPFVDRLDEGGVGGRIDRQPGAFEGVGGIDLRFDDLDTVRIELEPAGDVLARDRILARLREHQVQRAAAHRVDAVMRDRAFRDDVIGVGADQSAHHRVDHGRVYERRVGVDADDDVGPARLGR